MPTSIAVQTCIVSTVRAPLDDTLRFAFYHLNTGMDALILFFDDPEDPAIERLRPFGRITVIACDDTYWQAAGISRNASIEARQIFNADRGLSIAKTMHMDWIIHIDSDELIYTRVPLGELLSGAESDVVRFDIREAIPRNPNAKEAFDGISLFKRPSSRLKRAIVILLGCRHAVYHREYFRGHLESKSAVRVDADIPGMGIHWPKHSGMSSGIVTDERIVLLHFESCSFSAWNEKWARRSDGSASASKLRGNRKRQFEAYRAAAAKDTEALRTLYRRFYLIPPYELRILKTLDMIERIELDPSLFDAPSH